MNLKYLMRKWRTGSVEPPWTWKDEIEKLWCTEPDYMAELVQSIMTYGVREPILLGDDGRVWDGHHRVVAAYHIGRERVPLEYV